MYRAAQDKQQRGSLSASRQLARSLSWCVKIAFATAFAASPSAPDSLQDRCSRRHTSTIASRHLALSAHIQQEVRKSLKPTSMAASQLHQQDKEVWKIIQAEYRRQRAGLELIASENFVSRPVLEALGSVMTNKYSEGRPGARYYGGNVHIDQLERLCQTRALNLFNLSSTEWGVNVQPYSGSPANFAVYTGLLSPHERMMGLDLPSGGHLTHGYYTASRRISAASIFFESLPYRVNPHTGLIDYNELEDLALRYRPKLLIAGASAYPRDWDYQRMRSIADACGAFLMTDMAHVSGLVAGGVVNNPFAHSHVVTSTTHKSLRGPRSGLIFYRKELGEQIDAAVFPALQGGPHNHQIAALAVALQEAAQPSFKIYAHEVRNNAVALAKALRSRGHEIVTGGTDNHLVLWDLRPHGITGSKVEKVAEAVGISLNRNTVPGDRSAGSPGGVRIGTPAMTTRGLREPDVKDVADYLDQVLKLALALQASCGNKLKDYEAALLRPENIIAHDVLELRKNVEQFSARFPVPMDAGTLAAE